MCCYLNLIYTNGSNEGGLTISNTSFILIVKNFGQTYVKLLFTTNYLIPRGICIIILAVPAIYISLLKTEVLTYKHKETVIVHHYLLAVVLSDMLFTYYSVDMILQRKQFHLEYLGRYFI